MSEFERIKNEYEKLINEYRKCFTEDIHLCRNFDPYNFDENKEKSLKKACILIKDMITKKKDVFKYDWSDDVYDKTIVY